MSTQDSGINHNVQKNNNSFLNAQNDMLIGTMGLHLGLGLSLLHPGKLNNFVFSQLKNLFISCNKHIMNESCKGS